VKTIYVKNLPENASKEKIKELFDKHGEVTTVVLSPAKAGHKRDFGFVHFVERLSALKEAKGSEKYDIDGNLPSCYRAYPLKFIVEL
jgi:heterogeneous nuclear ribonucleoprotein R